MARCACALPGLHTDQYRHDVGDADRDAAGEGEASTQDGQRAELSKSVLVQVRTVGISVLGPGEGPFELGIESFECVNVEARDADALLGNARKTLAQEPQAIAYVMSQGRNSGR